VLDEAEGDEEEVEEAADTKEDTEEASVLLVLLKFSG
jgi:hypothetical protein